MHIETPRSMKYAIWAGMLMFSIAEAQAAAPVANAGADQNVAAGEACTATVTLDGSASTDADGDALTYTWTGAFPEGSGTVSGITAVVTLSLGINTITLTVDDGTGGIATDTVDVTVADLTPPVISDITVSPATLWPPNHKMKAITISATVTDNCDTAATWSVGSVTSNEPENDIGDGNTAPDWEITGAQTVSVRAERAGPGSGRIYTITLSASDASGNTATGTATVTVPHDQSGKVKKPKPAHGNNGGTLTVDDPSNGHGHGHNK